LQFGTTPIKSLPIDVLGTLVSKEITISSSFLFSGTMQRAVELVNKRIIRLDKIIGHKFNLKEFINNIGDKKMREAGKFVVFPNKTL
jgi:threonine dehydrogenase-like Zn-dependent dehydrogenase